ncbi:VirB8/TrbF family protein [Erwinia amylovora]|uniref:virB8 family protein n=1 Tax=Erwinia amylovora TaxID=552 RepID=UPI0022AB6856|nr:VirB8/TrbF family protein [Erwinia amylovora]MCZ2719994.1 VirB8/TrbF family protein [Erwinia amylovora]
MVDKKTSKTPDKKITDKDYFDEAKSWDEDSTFKEKKSTRRAWMAFWTMASIAVVQGIGIMAMLPLKTVETAVIRVNDATGETEVVSNLKNMDENTEMVMRRYWLAKYINSREGYHWNTRDYDREQVGIMSDGPIQQQYADYTNPRTNPNSPVVLYGDTTEVDVKVNPAITYINGEKGIKNKDGEKVYTALVRYTATVKKEGERPVVTHWAATVSFVYRKEPIKVDDRLINPVGFQVTDYRKDQEGG